MPPLEFWLTNPDKNLILVDIISQPEPALIKIWCLIFLHIYNSLQPHFFIKTTNYTTIWSPFFFGSYTILVDVTKKVWYMFLFASFRSTIICIGSNALSMAYGCFLKMVTNGGLNSYFHKNCEIGRWIPRILFTIVFMLLFWMLYINIKIVWSFYNFLFQLYLVSIRQSNVLTWG